MLKPNKKIVADADADAEQQWAIKISATYQGAAGSLIESGRMLVQAKQELPHGKFLRLVHEKLPFGARTAQRLMCIALHKALNATDLTHLPPAVTTLAVLCSLPDHEFEQCVASGQIHADMREEDARWLKRKKVLNEYPDDPLPSFRGNAAHPSAPSPEWDDEAVREKNWNDRLKSMGEGMVAGTEVWFTEYEDWDSVKLKPGTLKALKAGFEVLAPLLEKSGWQRAAKGGPRKKAGHD